MVELYAHAKINLFLEVTSKLANGYHTISTVMQSVSLADKISLELLPGNDIIITSNDSTIPFGINNIAYKTARAYMNEIKADFGLRIAIEKNIPSQAGMGGGSADGAAVLYGLEKLCDTCLGYDRICDIGASLGADIPFCINGGTALLSHIGTEIVETFSSPQLDLVIAKPPCGISTPIAYSMLDILHDNFINHCSMKLPPIDLLKKGCKMFNRFEEVLDRLCPRSADLISELNNQSHGALLSGSGAAVFAVADDAAHARRLSEKIKEMYPECFVTVAQTAPAGCIVI